MVRFALKLVGASFLVLWWLISGFFKKILDVFKLVARIKKIFVSQKEKSKGGRQPTKDINFKQSEDVLFLEEEHIILKEQIKKFVETEVKPEATKWEVDGFIPREVFKKMGALGFLGITYPIEFGGSEMDVRGSVVFAEELGKSTFSGFAIASLVHTDMASVHLLNACLLYTSPSPRD